RKAESAGHRRPWTDFAWQWRHRAPPDGKTDLLPRGPVVPLSSSLLGLIRAARGRDANAGQNHTRAMGTRSRAHDHESGSDFRASERWPARSLADATRIAR